MNPVKITTCKQHLNFHLPITPIQVQILELALRLIKSSLHSKPIILGLVQANITCFGDLAVPHLAKNLCNLKSVTNKNTF